MGRREVASLRWGSHRHEYGLGRHVARETLLRDQEDIEFRDPVLNEYHTEIKDEIKTYVLTDVVLFPAGFLTAEGVVIRESLRLQNHPPMAFRLRHCEVLDAERLLAMPLSANYYHFMQEGVPRILLARKEIGNICLVVTKNLSAFQAEVLKMLAVDVEVRMRATALPLVNFVNISQPSGLECASVTELSAALSHPNAEPSGYNKPNSNSRPIYISRRGSSRLLLGEEELEQALSRCGFRVVRTEELSVREQIHAFRSTDCVVAPHGAGLSNIAFCAPGTRVVQIMDRAYSNPCFQVIARAKSLNYDHPVSAGHC